MYRDLNQAPSGEAVFIAKIADARLASQLALLGLEEGVEVRKLADHAVPQPLWIQSAKSEAILGGEMAAKIVVSYDQGRKMCSLVELPQDKRGFFKTLIGKEDDLRVFRDLELKFGEPVTLLRKLPLMDYIARRGNGGSMTLRGESACRIWGKMDGREMPFASSLIRHRFKITKILGGKKSKAMMSVMALHPGVTLTLMGLEKTRAQNPAIIMTAKGGMVRLILVEDAASRILVRDCEICWTCGECLLTVPGMGEIFRLGSK
jgi:Fe2+ transport system protein FeoA